MTSFFAGGAAAKGPAGSAANAVVTEKSFMRAILDCSSTAGGGIEDFAFVDVISSGRATGSVKRYCVRHSNPLKRAAHEHTPNRHHRRQRPLSHRGVPAPEGGA